MASSVFEKGTRMEDERIEKAVGSLKEAWTLFTEVARDTSANPSIRNLARMSAEMLVTIANGFTVFIK